MKRFEQGKAKNAVLALDLEGTLISSAVTRLPRPGLFDFLSRCRELFSRIVIFSAVKEETVKEIACRLVDDGKAPKWFADLEYVQWDSHAITKDLKRVQGVRIENVVLVDDCEMCIHPDQKQFWVKIPCFDPPLYSDQHATDFRDVLEKLR